MAGKAFEYDDIKPCLSASLTSSLLTGIAVDTTGYDRARFIIMVNQLQHTGNGKLVGTGGIWKCATSDGTYVVGGATSVSAISSNLISDTNLIVEIDIPTEAAYPWLIMSSYSLSVSTMYVAGVCQLYHGRRRPDTTRGVNQTVTL